MIVNHTHRFIFVHVPKAAGTSITAALSPLTRYCDQEIGGSHFGEGVQDFYGARFGLKKHSRAVAIRAVVGQEVWDSYLTFAFVRDPFARLVSSYHFLKAWNGAPREALSSTFFSEFRAFDSLDAFLVSDFWWRRGVEDTIFAPQACWLTAPDAPDRPIVAEIGRVERLDADLAAILARLGAAPAKGPLRRVNRTEYVPPTIYPAGVADRVRDVYATDFAMLGYDAVAS